MLEVAADKKLRLSRGDVEGLIFRFDGVGDLLHVGFQAGNRFADG